MTGYVCVIRTAYNLDEMYSADIDECSNVVKTKEEALQYLQEQYNNLLYEEDVDESDYTIHSIYFNKEELEFDLSLYDGAQRHHGYAAKFTL